MRNQSRNHAVWYAHMENVDHPQIISPRVYKRHRLIVKKASRKLKVSDAEVVRRALEAFIF